MDLAGSKIGLGRSPVAKAIGFVGQFRMKGSGIGIGINSNRCDAIIARGANDADRDLAAIGDQKLLYWAAFPEI